MNILSFFVSVLFTATSSAPNPSVAAPIMMSAIMSASTPTVAAAMATTFSKPTPYVLVTSFVAVTLSGCKRVREFVGELMRTEPKPGRKHPGSDHKFNRTWVYKEPAPNKTREDPRSAEQLAVAAAREKMEADDLAKYNRILALFDEVWPSTQNPEFDVAYNEFAAFLNFAFVSEIGNPARYKALSRTVDNTTQTLLPRSLAYVVQACSTGSLEPNIRLDLHTGDSPDSEMHYVVMNGLFPIFTDDRFCRFFQIDIARLGWKKDTKTRAEIDTILPILISKNPLTDGAWFEESTGAKESGALEPDFRDINSTNNAYPPHIRALFHSLVAALDEPIGLRFIEIQVHKGAEKQVKSSNTQVMILDKRKPMSLNIADTDKGL